MTETITTTFRFPLDFQFVLTGMSMDLNTSRRAIVQESVLFTAGLLNEASRASYVDLDELRARYGDDAILLMGVSEEDGKPVGKLLINGKDPEDVRAIAYVDEATGEAHMFLSVLRDHTSNPNFVKIGDEALLVAHPRMPVGTLPWPPKPDLAIQIRLADIKQAAKEAEQQVKELIRL